jgi:ABC-type multidrug transport system ATPase subunit
MSVQVHDVRKRFGRTTALDGLTLDVGPGVTGLLGPNGAGKTTLMAMMTGFLAPSAGTVTLDGVDWMVEDDERWVILGPNGAGKTTLMQLCSAQIHPTSGIVGILGEVRRRDGQASHQHPSLGRPEDPVEVEHQRGLAGAVGAEQRDPLAGVDVQVDAVERLVAVGVGVGESTDVEDGGAHRGSVPV